jgi:hypothetical protein
MGYNRIVKPMLNSNYQIMFPSALKLKQNNLGLSVNYNLAHTPNTLVLPIFKRRGTILGFISTGGPSEERKAYFKPVGTTLNTDCILKVVNLKIRVSSLVYK